MNSNEANKIIEAFKSKVGDRKELLYSPQPLKMCSGVHSNFYIFDGPGDDANRIAALGVQIFEDASRVILVVGMNEFSFFENPELCLELIERIKLTL